MATQIQYRRGTNAQNAAFTGALAEITVDTTNGTLRVHDGITAGGSNIATVAYVAAQIGALSSNSISSGTSNVRVFANGNVTTSVAGTDNVLNVTSTGILITGLVSATGNVSGGNLNVTGNIVDTGALGINTGSNGNITLNAGSGFIIASSGILNGQANGVGNIGNATGYFNTVFAKATSAQYADLAEMYVADQSYEPGTVVVFGGAYEVEISATSHANHVAGVISTNPSYIMNAGQQGTHVAAVALMGRVPTKVVGTIKPGDKIVTSSIPGVAQGLDLGQYEPGCIIGKALQAHQPTYDKNGNEIVGTIEVVVGRI
jgi:hypothetical protein